MPAKALFANRAHGLLEELRREEQLKEARVAVTREVIAVLIPAEPEEAKIRGIQKRSS